MTRQFDCGEAITEPVRYPHLSSPIQFPLLFPASEFEFGAYFNPTKKKYPFFVILVSFARAERSVSGAALSLTFFLRSNSGMPWKLFAFEFSGMPWKLFVFEFWYALEIALRMGMYVKLTLLF